VKLAAGLSGFRGQQRVEAKSLGWTGSLVYNANVLADGFAKVIVFVNLLLSTFLIILSELKEIIPAPQWHSNLHQDQEAIDHEAGPTKHACGVLRRIY
jgi:hypothetical protein